MSQNRVLPEPDEPMTQAFRLRALAGFLGRVLMVSSSVPVRMILFSNLGSTKGLMSVFRSPPGGAVFLVPPVLLGIFAFEVDQQAKSHRPHKTHQPVKGIKPWRKVSKGWADAPAQPQQLFTKPGPRRQTICRPQLQTGPADE